MLGRLGVAAAGRAAARVAAELDAASVVRRMEAAARSRRVTVRPAPDGMAYLTVLAPLRESVGAYAALRARAAAVVGGQCPDEAPEGRGVGAVMADTATRLLSGRAVGQVQPLEVHLVITDTALLGPAARARSAGPRRANRPITAEGGRRGGDRARPGSRVTEASRRRWRGAGCATPARELVWLRRLYTSPEGRDLVAMDSPTVFTGLLQRMLVLRDDVCATPWGRAPDRRARRPHQSGPRRRRHRMGQRHRAVRIRWGWRKTGWRVSVIQPGPAAGTDRRRERPPQRWRAAQAATSRDRAPSTPSTRWAAPFAAPAAGRSKVTTPTGHRYRDQAPPLTGWGGSSPATQTRTHGDQLERHLTRLLAAAA